MNATKFLLLCASLAFAGCSSIPSDEIEKAERDGWKAKEQLWMEQNEKAKDGAAYVHATGRILSSDPAPSRYSSVASELNDRAEALLPKADTLDEIRLNKVADALAGDDEKEKAAARESIADFDQETIDREARIAKLSSTLSKIQIKYEEAVERAKDMSDKQAEADANWWNPFYDFGKGIKKALVWLVIVIGFILLLPLMSFLFPAIAPIIMGISRLVGSAIGWIFKLLPAAAEGAGVVASGAFATVVNGLEKAKASMTPDDVEKLHSTLGREMDRSEKALVTQYKRIKD